MSDRDRAKQIIDQLSNARFSVVFTYLQDAAVLDSYSLHDANCACPLCRVYRYPNTKTLEAFSEIENGDGEVFTGSTDDFIKSLLAE